MTCPYLKEVVMLYCDACPIKKMVPLDRIVSASPCLVPDFGKCRVYQQALASARHEGSEASVVPPEAIRREAH